MKLLDILIGHPCIWCAELACGAWAGGGFPPSRQGVQLWAPGRAQGWQGSSRRPSPRRWCGLWTSPPPPPAATPSPWLSTGMLGALPALPPHTVHACFHPAPSDRLSPGTRMTVSGLGERPQRACPSNLKGRSATIDAAGMRAGRRGRSRSRCRFARKTQGASSPRWGRPEPPRPILSGPIEGPPTLTLNPTPASMQSSTCDEPPQHPGTGAGQLAVSTTSFRLVYLVKTAGLIIRYTIAKTPFSLLELVKTTSLIMYNHRNIFSLSNRKAGQPALRSPS